MDFGEWLSLAPKNSIGFLILLGYLLCFFNHIILTLFDYLQEKSWRINDYERALYLIQKSFYENNLDIPSVYAHVEHTTNRAMLRAYGEYSDKLDRKNIFKKYKDKIKSIFKRK